MSDGGKGDKQRPTDYQSFAESYDRIFSGKTQRGSFVQDPATGKLVERSEFYAGYEPAAPYVIGDIQPYQSMQTGEMITSRSHHRMHLKQHGLVEIGNEVDSMLKIARPAPKIDREAIRRTLADVLTSKGY